MRISDWSSDVCSSDLDKLASPLALALGKDISGRPAVVDLARMPHLLVAGTTGSGKSVGLNAMVLSLLYKASATDVRLLMIDPKMLRSEEHTSELQSLMRISYAVFCLKKKKISHT